MSPFAFVLAWVVHTTVLGLAVLALPALFRLRHTRALVAWWQHAAMFVVLMPLVPLWLPSQPAVPGPVMTFLDSTTVAIAPRLADAPGLSPLTWLAAIWGLGVALRLAWLVIGQRRLHRLASAGTPVHDDPALHRARALAPEPLLPATTPRQVPVVAAHAAVPCVFGWRRVQVLVPTALLSLPEDQRLAVYLHELTHVARLDVARAYADEAWRLVWWWQPAVWWLLANLRLVREQQVDRAVVDRTGETRPYVEALLWCSSLRPALSLSPQVGDSGHALVKRVALMCKGGEMSRLRRWTIVGSMAVTAATVSAGVGLVSPLRAAAMQVGTATPEPGPLERVAARPTLEMPAPRRTHAVEPIWSEAAAYRFRVHLVIDAAGRVAEARLMGYPDMSSADELTRHLPAARLAALDAVRQWQFDAPAQAPLLLVTQVDVGETSSFDRMQFQPRDGRVVEAAGRPPLRISGTMVPPKKIFDVAPVYPQVAMDAKVQGVVIIECTVAADGTVAAAHVLRSIPLLDEAALDAVRQWRYSQTLLNGEPVPVIVTVTVNFSLK